MGQRGQPVGPGGNGCRTGSRLSEEMREFFVGWCLLLACEFVEIVLNHLTVHQPPSRSNAYMVVIKRNTNTALLLFFRYGSHGDAGTRGLVCRAIYFRDVVSTAAEIARTSF